MTHTSPAYRYKLVHSSEYRSQMLCRPDGGWVKLRDHDAAIARIKELEAALRSYICTCTVDTACATCLQDLQGCGMIARQALENGKK